MSKYPRDEFDRTPEFTDRKGVHREQPAVKGGGSGLGLLMGVGILALVVGLVSFLVLPRILGADATAVAAQTTAAASSSSEPAGSAAESEPAESESAESEPAESESAESEYADASEAVAAESPSASATPSETATAAAVNYAASVGVYNGSSISGLAGSGLAKLQGSGFSSLTAGNWTKKVDASVVYYKSDASRATALETARVLGIATVYQTANVPAEISVVLGRSYG